MPEASQKKRLATKAAWIARRRNRARDGGFCITCLEEKAAAGRRVCDACNQRARERVARYRKKKRDSAVAKRMLHESEHAGDEAYTQHFYEDAIRHFEEALGIAGIESADQLRLWEKLASVFFSSGDPERANPWMERILEGYLRKTETKEQAVDTLIHISWYRWLDCQTKAALPFVARALQLIQADDNPYLYTFVNLIMAARFIDLGHYDEAEKYVETAGELTSKDAIPLPHNKALLRAICAAAEGRENEAFAGFEEVVRLAEAHPVGGYHWTTVLDDYGLWAMALGKIETAKNCHKRALLFAQQHQILWRIPYLSLRYADVLMRMGQYESACEYLNDALSCDIHVPRIVVMAAFVGIPIALYLNNGDLLQRCSGNAAVDLAFQSGENMLIGRTAAAFAQLFAAQGHSSEARSITHRALGAVRSVELHWELPIAAAHFGMDADVRYARALLEQRASLPCADVAQAFLSFFDAVHARRRGRVAKSRAAAASAVEQFALIQWHGYADRVHETIDPATIRRPLIQSRSIANRGISNGMLPALTSREQQVAELVFKGLTNRAIAAELSISEHTVETHMTSIMGRWGIRSRHQLVDMLSASGA